jgi:hypothetical protein
MSRNGIGVELTPCIRRAFFQSVERERQPRIVEGEAIDGGRGTAEWGEPTTGDFAASATVKTTTACLLEAWIVSSALHSYRRGERTTRTNEHAACPRRSGKRSVAFKRI